MNILGKYGLVTILILTVPSLRGQEHKDTLVQAGRTVFDQFVLPATLLTGSVILSADPVRQEIQRFFPDTRTRVDDWLRYGPVAQLYAYDLMGYQHRSPVLIQTGNLVLSQMVSGALVSGLKRSVNARRPSGGVHSYPSGHTNAAFVAATVLYLEFRDSEPLLAWSGYALATATGILRITNDAHWLPDVMAGAAIGMLVPRLVYLLDPIGRVGGSNGHHLRVHMCRQEKVNAVCLIYSF